MERRMNRTAIAAGPGGHPAPKQKGFTLIELMISTVVVGLAVAGLMMATRSATTVNGRGRDMAKATFLAQEIRERCFAADIDDIVSATYNPPVDARLSEIDGYAGWSQVVTAYYVDPDDVDATPVLDPDDPDYIVSSDMKYVRCEIQASGVTVLTTGWLVTRR